MNARISLPNVGVTIGLVLSCTFSLTGCATATVVAQLEPQLVSERLPFVQDGKTSKEEVLRSLGEPDYRYEGGRILTYKMCYVPEPKWFPWGNYPLSSPEPPRPSYAFGAARCSPERTNALILVFGPDNLVERHSMVVVK